MKPEQLHILQHSLGVDQYSRGPMYRNHYASDPNPDLITLVELGYLTDCGPQPIWGGLRYYWVTDSGKAAMFRESPKAPALTDSQKRYARFLRADCGMRFGEWLKKIEPLTR